MISNIDLLGLNESLLVQKEEGREGYLLSLTLQRQQGNELFSANAKVYLSDALEDPGIVSSVLTSLKTRVSEKAQKEFS